MAGAFASTLAAGGLFALSAGGLALALAGFRLARLEGRLDGRLAARVSGGRAPAEQGALARFTPRFLSAHGRDRAEIEQQLRGAGFFRRDAVAVFASLRLIVTLAVSGLVMVLVLASAKKPASAIFPTLAAAGLTWIGCKLVLQMRAAERERVLTAEFPFLLDLMLMMLESGVSLDQAMRAIARDERVAAPNHARLMAMLVDDIDRGQDYQLAFDRWATRVNVAGARELAALFRQSLFQGMELVPALRAFASEFSQRRVAKAREAIGRITVRMVILMLVFFMPALFIVLAGPPVAAIIDTLREAQR